MARSTSRLLVFLLLFACVGCDQVTKHAARTYLPAATAHAPATGVVQLRFAENRGAMLSFGEDLPEGIRFTIFTAANALLLCGILWYLAAVRPGDWRRMTGLALMAGGGAGNLLDRLGNDGKVVDFILLELGPLHTGIFNLADVVILMGFALLTASFFGREKVRSGSDEGPRLTESAG